jgi:hypothetical protein
LEGEIEMAVKILYMEVNDGDIPSVEFTQNPTMNREISELMHKWGISRLDVRRVTEEEEQSWVVF